MATTLELLLIGKDAGLNAALGSASKNVKQLGNDAEKTGGQVEAAGKHAADGLGQFAHSEAFGLSRREFSHLSGAASEAMSVVGEVAGKASAELGKMVSTVSGLASAFLFAGPLGAAIAGAGLAIGALVDAQKNEVEQIKQQTEYTDAYLSTIRTTVEGNKSLEASFDALATKIADQKTLWGGLVDGLNDYAITSARKQVAELGDSADEADKQLAKMRTTVEQIADMQINIKVQIDSQGSDQLEKLRESNTLVTEANYADVVASDKLRESRDALDTATKQLSSDTDAYYSNLVKVKEATNTQFYDDVKLSEQQHTLGQVVASSKQRWSEYDTLIGQRFPTAVGAASIAYDNWQTALKDTSGIDAAKKAMEQFQGLVENALTPTKVTDQDVKDTAAGTYKNKWDELAREAEAVDTGSAIEKFDGLKQALDETGLSAGEFAKEFRDMSLFVNPENIKFADLSAVTADVKHQLDELAGKANLTDAAMKAVWASLAPQQKATLAKQGITNAADAMTALEDPTAKAKDQVNGLNNALGAIPRSITTTFNVIKDAAEQGIKDFQTVLDDFIAKYGNVNINISATAGTSAGTTTTTATTAGVGGRLAGGYATDGLYHLGENKQEEFVLPAPMVKFIEQVLGHRISSPAEIGWLIGALGRGQAETSNQLALFASGHAGRAVSIPTDAGKWISGTYDQYQKDYGFNKLPTSVQAAHGGGGSSSGGSSSGGGIGSEALAVLHSIDNTLKGMAGITATNQQRREARTITTMFAHGMTA